MRPQNVGLLLCSLLLAAALASPPTTAPATVQYGGVSVRSDAPEAVHDYFKLISKWVALRQKSLNDSKASLNDVIHPARATVGRRPRLSVTERQDLIGDLNDEIAERTKQLAVVMSPDFRPPMSGDPEFAYSGKICMIADVVVMSVHDERHFLGAFGTLIPGVSHAVGNGSSAIVVTDPPTTSNNEGGFEVESTKDLIDKQIIHRTKPFMRDGTYSFVSVAGQRTVPLFRELNVDPEQFVIRQSSLTR